MATETKSNVKYGQNILDALKGLFVDQMTAFNDNVPQERIEEIKNVIVKVRKVVNMVTNDFDKSLDRSDYLVDRINQPRGRKASTSQVDPFSL